MSPGNRFSGTGFSLPPANLMKSLIQAIASALCLLLAESSAVADVIYLTNGNVLVVQKAWEEGSEVRYQTGSQVQTLPKSAVRRIQEQKALPAPEGGAPRYGIAIGDGSPAAVANSTPSETTSLRQHFCRFEGIAQSAKGESQIRSGRRLTPNLSSHRL